MLESVEAFEQSENFVAMVRFEDSRRYFHVYQLVKFGIEVGSDDINLINFPIVLCGFGQDYADGSNLRGGSKGFIVVDTFDLSMSTGDESDFVLDYLGVGA